MGCIECSLGYESTCQSRPFMLPLGTAVQLHHFWNSSYFSLHLVVMCLFFREWRETTAPSSSFKPLPGVDTLM